jgi:hypothetical protein
MAPGLTDIKIVTRPSDLTFGSSLLQDDGSFVTTGFANATLSCG